MTKILTMHLIKECKQQQEVISNWNANHIQFKNYFKYSGYIEETSKILLKYYDQLSYKVKLEQPAIKHDLITWYLNNPNESIYSAAYKFNLTYNEANEQINNHLIKTIKQLKL